jgi:signal transduction histidine kinase
MSPINSDISASTGSTKLQSTIADRTLDSNIVAHTITKPVTQTPLQPIFENSVTDSEVERASDDLVSFGFQTLLSKPVSRQYHNSSRVRAESQTKKDIIDGMANLTSHFHKEGLEMKRLFIRHVSHEVRTPLTIVLSGLEALRSILSGNNDALGTVEETLNACTVAVDTLNDLLTYEKLDTNVLFLNKSMINAVEVVSRVHELFVPQAKYADIQLSLSSALSDSTMIIVIADPVKLAQAVRNLLSNALKFTPVGGLVSLHLSTVSKGHQDFIRINVTGRCVFAQSPIVVTDE